MSTDKAMMKTLIQNFSLEMIIESNDGFDELLTRIADADGTSGTRYGTRSKIFDHK